MRAPKGRGFVGGAVRKIWQWEGDVEESRLCWTRVLIVYDRSWCLSIQLAANASIVSADRHRDAQRVRLQHLLQYQSPTDTLTQASSLATPPQPTPLTVAKRSMSAAHSPTPPSC